MKCKDCYVEGCTHRPFPNEAECVFRQWTVKQFDWQSFRTEAAKDILLNSLIPYALKEFREESINIDYWTNRAVEWADCLISKLKEKEEK